MNESIGSSKDERKRSAALHKEEILDVLSKAAAFLDQERLLFGNTIYTEPVTTKRKSAIPAIEELSLFEEPPAPAKRGEPWESSPSLDDLNAQICNCRKCSLGSTRTNFVFGVGSPTAEVMAVGEAPGADEDAQGEPFVGRAGQLLNKILEAIHFKREEVYICNILKCRPPDNRRPLPSEVDQCEPYLWKQIELVKPKIILCLGLTAAQTLLKTTDSLTQLRTSVHNYRGVPLFVTYHPAALLRNPNWKRPTWEDVQRMRKTYDEIKK